MKKSLRIFAYLITILYFLGAIWHGVELFKESAISNDSVEYARLWMGLFPTNYFTILLLILGVCAASLLIIGSNSGETIIVQQLQEAQSKVKLQHEIDGLDEFKKLEQSILLHLDHLLLDSKIDAKYRLQSILSYVCTQLKAGQGIIYTLKFDQGRSVQMAAGYAVNFPDSVVPEFEFGEGLVGQVAKEQKIMNVHGIEQHHTSINSGLGKSVPTHLLICPIVRDAKTLGVWEMGSFTPFTQDHERLMKEVAFKLSNTLESAQS